MTELQARELIENYLEAYNLFEVDDMLACLHPDVTFENISAGVVTHQTEGKDAFEAQAKQASELFMERNQHILAFRFQNNRAEADIQFFAITAIDWPDSFKAGTILELTGQSFFAFCDNLITSIRDIN